MNPLLDSIAAPPRGAALADYRGELALIDLTVGTPWYGPPHAFCDAMTDLVRTSNGAAREHDLYAPPLGAPALREAVAQHYQDSYGLHFNPGLQVLITHGATGAVWIAVLAATAIGDEVLLPDPCYALYESIVTILGRRARRVAGDPASGLLLDPDTVAHAIGPRSKMLLINSPVNPTGAMYGKARLQALVRVTTAAGLHVVHDEVLDCFARRQPHVPAAAVAGSGVVMANSLSKRFGITGWRLGWLVGDPDVLSAAARVHPLGSIAVNHACQLAAAAALDTPDHAAFVAEHAAGVAAQGEEFLHLLSKVPGFPDELSLPDGGVYAFVDVSGVADRLGCSGGSEPSDIAVTRILRERCGVAVLPGSAFGVSGAGYIRISLAVPPSQLTEAGRRLVRM